MLKFFKTWTLPISMLAGAIGYFVFANVTFLEPTKLPEPIFRKSG